ncbi:hypothetical protein RMATCC62417_16978 [Rhizopus microsporus]|nr:hypothetical protein RMATCC62417_16978 [Rhizopus microsporus]
MVPKKRLSKRVRLSKKYSIKGKIKEHQRKEKRQGRKNPQPQRKSKKDPGIPNNWPFKEELLNEVEKQRLEAEEEKKRKRAASRKKKAAKKATNENTKEQQIEEEKEDEEEHSEEE